MGSDVEGALRDQLEPLLATAMALTGSAEAASALVGEVSSRARHQRVDVDPDDPGPGLRNLLVQRFVAIRHPIVPPSARSEQPDELTDRLDRLTRLQRAAAVLAWRDRLTHAEIAGIVDRPVAVISRHLDEAQTSLDAAPYEVAAALDQLAWSAPDPTTVRAGATAYERQRTAGRRRVAALTTVLIAAVALGLAIPTLVIPRLFPVYARTTGDWVYSFDLALPPGYRIQQRYLTRELDGVYVVTGDAPEDGCVVQVATKGTNPVQWSERKVRVNGRLGYWGTSKNGQPELRWNSAGPTASVTCDGERPSEALMLTLARGLTFRESAMVLPFRIAAMPEGYEIEAVGTDITERTVDADARTAIAVVPIGESSTSGHGIYVDLPNPRPTGADLRKVQIGQVEGLLDSQLGDHTLCLPAARDWACLASTSESGRGRQDIRLLIDLASQFTFAPDPRDPATWFDARDALPH